VSPLRVLIVADDPVEANELAAILSGCEVETASYADAPRKSSCDLVVLARPGDVRKLLEAARRQQASTIVFDGVQVDFTRGEAVKNGSKIKLTSKEMDLLRCLYDHRPVALSRDELLQRVWEYQEGVSTRTVDVHMSGLRQKLEDNPRRPRYLRSVRGVGYRFVA
jgi:two-component system alkaline phosphatase synthesis response regulator PhoP